MFDRFILFLGGVEIALGGLLIYSPTLQSPHLGILVIAVGLVTAGYAVWVVQNELHEWLYRLRPSELMPLVELRDLAPTYGWDFGEPSLQVLDLMRALNEAGARGLLQFYARENPDSTALIRGRPRALVLVDEWRNLQLSPNGFIVLECQDNMLTELHKRKPFGEKTHSDVYVMRRHVRRWLRRHAREFRGQHEVEKRPMRTS
jgi:hypothetical protein